MSDKKCKGDHRSHLCSLAGKRRIGEIKHLVTDPKYICSKCGRVADEGERVCKAEPLEI
jgi:hypothetical protein